MAALQNTLVGAGVEIIGATADFEDAVRLAHDLLPPVALVDADLLHTRAAEVRRLLHGAPGTAVLAWCQELRARELGKLLSSGAVGYIHAHADPSHVRERVVRAANGEAVLDRDDILELADLLPSLAKTEEAVKTATEIVQRLSHELLTPYTVVQGVVQLLADHPNLPPERVQALAASAMRAGQRLKRLLANLSAAAVLEDTRPGATPLAYRAGNIVRDAIENFSVEPRIVVSATPIDTDTSVAVYPTLAALALTSVVDNALRFSPADQPIHIHIRIARLAADVEIAVADAGPGVPEPFRELIFEPFIQVDADTVGSHRGLGLGLYLARRSLEPHGGRLDLRHTGPGGSTFVLSLPRLDTASND